MAFDGFAPNDFHNLSAPHAPVVPIEDTGFPVRAGSYIAMHDRVALTLGYGAFGLCIGAVAALMVGGLDPMTTATLAAIPAIGAVIVARTCVRVLHWSALPLLALIVAAAAWAVASTTLPDRQADFLPAIGMFALALPLTSIACCRAFPAAFAVSMLGMALAAPVGAATMLSIFG